MRGAKSRWLLRIASAWVAYKLLKRYVLNHGVTFTYNKRQSSRTKPLAEALSRHPLFQQYQPPLWLLGGVLQTAATAWLPKPAHDYTREKLLLEEMPRRADSVCCPEVVPSGEVSLDWLHCNREDAPIGLLIPGLTGSSSEGYIRRAAAVLHKLGYRVVCYNPRGRGGTAVKTPFIYSVGYTEDLRRVVKQIKQRYPSARIYAAGYSLGSNYLAKFLGEEGSGSEVHGAVCLACPMDCLSCSNTLSNTMLGRLMDPFLVDNVQNMRRELEDVLKEHPDIDLERVREAKTMHEFDDSVIAPMFDFVCASDYYRHSSAGLYVSRIRVPTLFVHAKNDPIVPGDIIKMDNFRNGDHLISCMTEQGGHSMDWPVRDGEEMSSWSAQLIANFFETHRQQERVAPCTA